MTDQAKHFSFGPNEGEALFVLGETEEKRREGEKKEGPEGELRPKLLAACGLGGRGIGRHNADERRHNCMPGCKDTGGTPRSALTISKKQFTINLRAVRN
jgi:hypothetical protein